MTSKRDKFHPYTIPYSGTGAVPVGDSSLVPSSIASEVGINTQRPSSSNSLGPGSTVLRRPNGSPLFGVPTMAQSETPPSSGYIYSSCNNDPCEPGIGHINPYSPTYIQNGSVNSQIPSHHDPPFARQSHMPSDYIGMPAGDTYGVYHMTQAEADRVNEDVNEQAKLALIRSKNPPRPSNEALSSAMRIPHGTGISTANTGPHIVASNQDTTLADRKTESTNTSQALDLATTQNVYQNGIGQTKTACHSPNRPHHVSGQSAPQSGNPHLASTADYHTECTPSKSSETDQFTNPLYNYVSSPDLANLSNGHVRCRCGDGRGVSSTAPKASMVARTNQAIHFPSEYTAPSTPGTGQKAKEENVEPEAPTEPEDDPWVMIRDQDI